MPPCAPTLSCKPRTPTLIATVVLLGGILPAMAGNASASIATCPIDVGSYGYTQAAAQAALKAVSTSCSTVVFTAGTYVFSSSLKIGVAGVTVTAEDGAVIKPAVGVSISGGLIKVNAGGVTLSNLVIDGSGNSADGILVSAPNTTIGGTSLNVGGRAISILSRGADAKISGCIVTGFGDRGVLTQADRTTVDGCKVSGGHGTAMWAFSGADSPSFINNLISASAGMGMEFNTASNFTAAGNTISGSTTLGIHMLRSNYGTVENNTSYQNGSNGIDAHGSTNVTIRDNKSYLNGGPRFPYTLEGQGILVYCSQYMEVRNNTVWDNAQTQPGKRSGITVSDNFGANGEMLTHDVIVDGNTAYDDQPTATQAWAIRIGGPSGKKVGDLDFITVTNNVGYGNINAGLFTVGLAPGATFVEGNNDLRGR
jgi:parallel beta-helix repeat protein